MRPVARFAIRSPSLSARRAWIEINEQNHRRSSFCPSLSARRAWIEIVTVLGVQHRTGESLSARRAWIEMLESKQIDPSVMVALRKESVDRNRTLALGGWGRGPSLSARRAWIEIGNYVQYSYNNNVALRKESVDRNCNQWGQSINKSRRSPQGERG